MNFNKIVLLHTIYNHSNYILMETNVNQRILKIKKNEKLTNETLSQRANVSVETIKSMFSKKTNPNIDTIQKIYSAFPHYSLEWIICGIGEMYKSDDGARFIEIVAGKNLSIEELRREYLRLIKVEKYLNDIEKTTPMVAEPLPEYNNPYLVIETMKELNKQYKLDIEWYKKELDKKQEMIDIMLSGNVTIQK